MDGEIEKVEWKKEKKKNKRRTGRRVCGTRMFSPRRQSEARKMRDLGEEAKRGRMHSREMELR